MARITLAATLTITTTLPALAHTQEETEAWLLEWQAEIPETGMTIDHALEFADWHARHFYHFHPVSHTPVVRSPRTPPTVDRGMGSNVEQWRGLVAAYFPAEQVDRALCIMSYESGGDPTAKNPNSSASGLFQHLAKYWGPPTDRSGKAGWAGADIFDPTANTAVAAWLWSVGGWGHWSPYNRGLCR